LADLRKRYPEAFEAGINEREQHWADVARRERFLSSKTFREAVQKYKIDVSIFEIDSDGFIHFPVKKHFTGERLPKGYGYKGGAARALLLKNLGIDPTYTPRDMDIIRLDPNEPAPGVDIKIAKKFMPEDFSHKNGVEVIQKKDYFKTRDLTINEVLATDEEIIATPECILDSIRRIIRLTPFERKSYGPKMLAKMLRFYAEAIYRWDSATIEDMNEWEFEKNFISPFWLALQMDRAFEVGIPIAEQYTKELQKRGQIPTFLNNAKKAADYLGDLLKHKNFYYRHAPSEQFDMEEEWIQKKFEHLPKQSGFGKRR
jgi:hypothetical protein